MGIGSVFIIAIVLVALWVLGGAFSIGVSRKKRREKASQPISPEYRLADQWLQASQVKLESLIEKIESPLGTAQHELLDLRLEAGRLPQGVKSISEVRENLAGGINPRNQVMTLGDRIRLYLREDDFKSESENLIILKTPLGDIPCCQAFSPEEKLNDDSMKTAYQKLMNQPVPENGAGCLAFFPRDGQMEAFQAETEWVSAFKEHRLIPVDLKGLTALLIALKLYRDAEQTVGVFEAGVQSTQALVGQADRMAAELGRLNADSLRARVVLEGGILATPIVEKAESAVGGNSR